jgi:membrane protease YdiL (CAAX protease family)
MDFFKKHPSLTEAAISSIAFMLFAFFIRYPFPVRMVSFISLLIVAFLISRNLNSFHDLTRITGEVPSLKFSILITMIGICGGITLAVMYRWHLDAPLIPQSIHWFTVTAALIGCMEELVFRGYLQDSVKNYGPVFSVGFSTLSHTGYKCCLFLSPMALIKVDIGFLALWTIIAGLIFGVIRHLTRSIIPPLVAHAMFDIWVYAEFTKAPWWVW